MEISNECLKEHRSQQCSCVLHHVRRWSAGHSSARRKRSRKRRCRSQDLTRPWPSKVACAAAAVSNRGRDQPQSTPTQPNLDSVRSVIKRLQRHGNCSRCSRHKQPVWAQAQQQGHFHRRNLASGDTKCRPFSARPRLLLKTLQPCSSLNFCKLLEIQFKMIICCNSLCSVRLRAKLSAFLLLEHHFPQPSVR